MVSEEVSASDTLHIKFPYEMLRTPRTKRMLGQKKKLPMLEVAISSCYIESRGVSHDSYSQSEDFEWQTCHVGRRVRVAEDAQDVSRHSPSMEIPTYLKNNCQTSSQAPEAVFPACRISLKKCGV